MVLEEINSSLSEGERLFSSAARQVSVMAISNAFVTHCRVLPGCSDLISFHFCRNNVEIKSVSDLFIAKCVDL